MPRRISVKSASDIAKKWADVTPARAGYYESEAPAAAGEWEANTSAAGATYKAGVSVAGIQDRFVGGVKRAGAEKFRRKVQDALAIPNAGTHIEDINILDPIMDFYIRMYATNGSTSNVENSIIDVLDKISLIDGSDVLWSLDSEEILANQLYHYKETTDFGIDERPDVEQATVFKIPLGIGRMHPEVCFDPTRFANPQLVLEWDIANIRAVGVTGFVDDSLRLDIMADVVDQAPARPTGYLMTKEIQEYVSVASTEHRVELPVDYPYRTMYVRSYLDEKCPAASLEKVEHSINEDKYRPFDIYTDDWLEWLKEWYGMWHQGYWYFLAITATEDRNTYLRGNLSAALDAMTAETDGKDPIP